jgi:Ring finger domain
MSENRNKRVCFHLLGLLVSVSLILVIGFSVAYFPFVIFLFVTTATFFFVLKHCNEANERNRETPQNGRQQPMQGLPTPPNEHTTTNSDGLCSRPSMGRILKPVNDDEESGSCFESTASDESNSTPSVSSPAKQNCPLHRSVLSADFGDNEILAIDESACTICLVDYEHGEEIQRNGFQNPSSEGATCGHVFHPDCISTWIKSSGKAECPCCRRPFRLDTLPA